MPSTYLSLHYHLVFSTQDRVPMIADDWQGRLHEYLGGTINKLGGFSQKVGGVADHVHLLVGLKSTHTLADVMRELKKSSSQWVHQEIRQKTFAWQEGYAAFTVSPIGRERVRAYIAHQAEHHRQRGFRDELIDMLQKAGVEYDPRYLDCPRLGESAVEQSDATGQSASHTIHRGRGGWLASLRDAVWSAICFRRCRFAQPRCRFAQPPANG